MRHSIKALSLALGLLPLTAAEPTYGLGLSLKQNEQTIFAPLQFTPSLRLEGSLSLNLLNSKGSGRDIDHNYTSVGVGIFHVRPLSEAFQLYAGPRLTFTHRSFKMDGRSLTTSKGYGITPLVGLEYRLSRNLSLSGEAGVNWFKSNDEHPIIDDNALSESSTRQVSTHTAVTLRYWF